jgi:GT2 family glycosyltransferase
VGIRHALESGADCVLLLNNDALLEKSALSAMVSSLFSNPDRGAVVPKIYAHTTSGSRRLWAAGAKWHPFPPRVKMRGYGELDVGQYDSPEYLEYATACAFLIHRQAFELAGLLDESFFMYQEDYAFCDRLQSSGLKLYYQPQAVVYHQVSASTGEGSSTKWRYWSQGVARFYVQHYGSRSRAIVPLTAFLLWVMMRELSKGRLRWIQPFWQGLNAGLTDL